ncbi:MAG TPA: 4Fe-4S dicluster domain-containing protein [Methylomirabilota bacterium]|nr:4Fe-4S dicluster domain-containing protein [Methylomirabilota bacterium]
MSVRYGFVIDHRRCIGCHACTVACKEENRVPLGAFRTWVKYVEKGAFPDTRRYFSVLRCNHCDDAPCVAICPTVALYRRADGIVDFDGERCIGCKSCMQGCPYDALYIDPATNTAAKCHYCAHRVEVGLEPACVIVCPEQAIIAGDLDDPRTPIARLVAREQVQVRKPEQGTRPKVYYVGADASALAPSLQRPQASFVFGQRPAAERDLIQMVADVQAQARGGDGAVSRTVYDAPHAPRPWGWRVAAYLWTKSIAAGALMTAAMTVPLERAGHAGGQAWLGWGAPLLALVFLAITTALLVLDLKRPDRFLYVLFKANPRSWLARGAWILIAYGLVAALWLTGGLGGGGVPTVVILLGLLLGAATAGYSAFLFGQAEGRDFWQSPLLLPHLLVAALLAGAASLIVLAAVITGDAAAGAILDAPLLGFLVLHGVLLFSELGVTHANLDVARAAALVTRGPWRRAFWAGVVVAGVLAPFALIVAADALDLWPLRLAAAALALAGLWIWEDIWVKAGQSIPLS